MLKKKTKTPPPPQILEGEVPNYTDIGLDDDFFALVERKAVLAAKKKVIEEKEDEIKSQLLAIMQTIDHKSVQVGTLRVIYTEGADRHKLEPKLLLKNGVAADVIARSTVTTKGNPYVTVREAGAAE